MFKVSIKSLNFSLPGNDSLLDELSSVGAYIPQQCKDGKCGSCVAKCVVGTTNIISPEFALTSEQINRQLLLTCCRKADSDLVLTDVSLLERSLPREVVLVCKAVCVENKATDILELKLRYRPGVNFDVIPGQYLKLNLNGVTRNYSIFEHNKTTNEISFLIKHRNDGKFSGDLIGLKANTVIRANGPFGHFFRRDSVPDGCHEIYFATGAGIAPIYNILTSSQAQLSVDKTIVFWGNRFKTDFFELPKPLPSNVKLIKCLSREDRGEGYEFGYVFNVFKKMSLSDLGKLRVYCCGNIEMINDVKEGFFEISSIEDLELFSDAFLEGEEL